MFVQSLAPSYGVAKYGKITSSSNGLSFSKTLQNTSKTPDSNVIYGKGMKVYLPTKDTVGSGGSGSGLSFLLKYAPESTEDNPIMIAYGFDENQEKFEKKVSIKDINPYNATLIEMTAFESYYKLDKGKWISALPPTKTQPTLNSTHNFVSLCKDKIKEEQILGDFEWTKFYEKTLSTIQNILSNQKDNLEKERNYLLSLNRRI